MATAVISAGRQPSQDFSVPEVLSLIYVISIAFSSQMAMPLWIGAIMDQHGLSAAAVGVIGAAEMAAVAVTSLGMATCVHRLAPRPIVILGLLLLSFGNLVSAFAGTEFSLAASRVLVGCGKGIAVTMSFSLIAGTSRPVRLFSFVNASYMTFSVVFLMTMPSLILLGGAEGAFATLGIVGFVSIIALLWYPSERMGGEEPSSMVVGKIQTFGWAAFAALMAFSIAHNSIWTFIQRIGLRADLAPTEIGQALSLASFIAIGGPVLARVLDMRLGQILPILIGAAIDIVFIFTVMHPGNRILFLATVPCLLLIIMFVIPYFLGILSSADPAGRLAAAASAALTIGHSIGSFTGGWTIDRFGYRGLTALSSGMLVAVILLMGSLLSLMRERSS